MLPPAWVLLLALRANIYEHRVSISEQGRGDCHPLCRPIFIGTKDRVHRVLKYGVL